MQIIKYNMPSLFSVQILAYRKIYVKDKTYRGIESND